MRPIYLTLILTACAGSLLAEAAYAQTAKAIVREKFEEVALVREQAAKTTPYLAPNIDGHAAPVRALAFTPDSLRLCSAGMDKVIHVWQLPGALKARPKAIARERDLWRRERTIRWEIARGLRGTINCLSIAPNNGELAMAGFGARGSAGELVWVDPIDGRQLRTAYADDGTHRDSVVSLAHSANGRWLVSADIMGRVLLWRQGEKKPHEIHASDGRNQGVRPIAVVGNTHVLVPHYAGQITAGGGQKVPTWKIQYVNIVGKAVEKTFNTVHYVSVTALAASSDGRWFASADQARKVYLYPRTNTGGFTRKELLTGHVANSLAFSGDGRMLAVGTMGEPGRSEPEIRVYDTVTSRLLFKQQMDRSVVACAISPDGKWLAHVGGDAHNVYLRRLDKLEQEIETVIHGGERVRSIAAISKAGDYQSLFKTTDGTSGVFDPKEMRIKPADAFEGARPLTNTSFSGDWSAKIAANRTSLQLSRGGVNRGVVKLNWAYQGSLHAYCFLADHTGKPAAVAVGTDTHNGIFIYGLRDQGECPLLRYYRGHNDRVTSLSVSRDLKYLVSGSADGTVRYWKLENALADREVPRRWGAELSFTADRKHLKAREVVDSGPLHYKGVRDDDVITKVMWTERDDNGDPVVFSTTDPREMYNKLQTLPWHKQLTFVTRRGRLEQPMFNLTGGWNHYMAVFVNGRDWIAWHPSGYYTSSPGGERLIGWQVNNDLGMKPSYFEAMRFAKTLHQPELMAELLDSGSVDAAATKLKLNQQGGIEGVDDVPSIPIVNNPTEVRPPTVTIVTPRIAPGEHVKKTAATRVKIVAVAESHVDHPITSMQLLLNGRPYMDRQNAKGAERELVEKLATWEVELPAGENSIRVIADTKASQGTSDEINLLVEGRPDKPKLHILAIGISDYPEERMKLRFGRSDAESLAETLSRQAGELYDVQPAVVLSDRKATTQAVKNALTSLSDVVGPKDLTVLFYSGHGIRAGEEFHLFTADGDPDDIRGSCLSEKVIKEFAAGTPGTLVMMIDACHSGAFRVDRLVRDLARDDYAVIVMASSQGEEYSWEKEEWGAGAFTKAAREGLLGQADQNRDSYVLNIEIVPFIYNRVTELTDFAQNPVYTLPPIKPFRLARVDDAAE